MKQKALFNINRLISETENAVSPEAAFMLDLDYTIRKMNEYQSGYYYKKITKEQNPEYFAPSTVMINYVCVIDESCLPTTTEENKYTDTNRIIYHTNDQEYYVCVFSDGKPSRTYKPSSMNCVRQMYYQLIGADIDKQLQKSGDFYGICESGTDRHERIQNAISHMKYYGIDCEYVNVEKYVKDNNLPLEIKSHKKFETKLYDPIRNIVFLCDGIIKYKDEYYIIEIKTESTHKWSNRVSQDDSHSIQAYTYSLELGIDKVIFIYENRDVCSKKPYLVTVTDDNRRFVADRINSCNDYVSKKIPPPKVDNKRICQYCDYKTICKVDDCL